MNLNHTKVITSTFFTIFIGIQGSSLHSETPAMAPIQTEITTEQTTAPQAEAKRQVELQNNTVDKKEQPTVKSPIITDKSDKPTKTKNIKNALHKKKNPKTSKIKTSIHTKLISNSEIKKSTFNHIQSKMKHGLFSFYDEKTNKTLKLKLLKIHTPFQRSEGYSFLTHADFETIGQSGKLYDISFTLDVKNNKPLVSNAMVHKITNKNSKTGKIKMRKSS